MCLDVNYICNNQNNMKNRTESASNGDKNGSNYDFPIKCLCGGSLIEHQPVFDPKGDVIFVAWQDKVRVLSLETGESIRDLDDNKDGQIVGYSISPEDSKSLVACTENGTVLTWKLGSYVIAKKLKLNLGLPAIVTKFIATSIAGELHGIVSYLEQGNVDNAKIVLVELKKGKIVQSYDIPFVTKKIPLKVRIANGPEGSKYFVAAQGEKFFVIDKTSSSFVTHDNRSPINVIVCHPEEEMVATGDVQGRIKLFRNIYDERPIFSELHWHHMLVLSLAFSQSGTVLYSGGAEGVLVKWQINEKTSTKDFLPRFPGSIKHISVDPKHDKITISIDDNAIHIINSSFAQLRSIQDFTQASSYDLGHSEPFPTGLQINPRNHHIVTNGRIGHLQFFSTTTMKLLFNVDVSMRNVVPRTKNTNIFSTHVTLAAFSTSWMATVECWDDKVNSPESRLKFWKFVEEKQSYSLHTQIEQAHQKKISALEFSSAKNIKDLICASAGLDNCIKIWSLEKSEDVKNAKLIWLCIEQLSYKNLPIKSFRFSQDSSLLAAGFGNILCVWDTMSFTLKCALSAPAPNDGSTNRVFITLPPEEKKSPKKSQQVVAGALEKRRKIVELMKSVIDGTAGESIVKNMTQEIKQRYFKQKPLKAEKAKNLSKGERERIFRRVLAIPDLSFNQKIQILHKLHIYYKISSRVEEEVIEHMMRQSYEWNYLYKDIFGKIAKHQVRSHEQYKVMWRFNTWKALSSKRNRKMVTVRKLLTENVDEKILEIQKSIAEEHESRLPIRNLMQVNNVLFCTEECSHLVIITTLDRLLIWNLLTLKIQGSFKIHAKFITIDALTNLVAVFTKYNELFIIHPSPALTIHHQKNMPDTYGAVWVPRENPKVQYVNVNWQASSQLLFLNHNQQICTFKIPGDDDYNNAAPYMEITNNYTSSTPFAAMIAHKISHETSDETKGMTKRIAVSGSGAVKDIINLSSHAMPPMRLLSKDFIGSMLSTQKQEKPQRQGTHEIETMVISDDEADASPEDKKIVRRKAMEKEEKAMREKGAKKKEAVTNIESRLKSLKLDFIEDFEV